MRTIIVGCGRVGAELASALSRAGHEVVVVDVSTEAFSRLPEDFPGQAIRGDGTDEDVLRRAAGDGADNFFALTEGDNRNILAAQLAAKSLGIPSVVAKINDPLRAAAYSELGIATICRTRMMVHALSTHMGLQEITGDPASRGVIRAAGRRPNGGRSEAEPTSPAAEPIRSEV